MTHVRSLVPFLLVGLCCPAARGAEPVVVPAPPITLPASVDLRPKFELWSLTNRSQGKRGTCSVFAVTGAWEFAAASSRGRGERFSVEFLNWSGNQVIGRPKDGGFFSDLWRGY